MEAGGIGVLPRDLLGGRRLRERPQPRGEAGIRRGELVRAHRLGPAVAGLPDGAEDLGLPWIEFVVDAHAGLPLPAAGSSIVGARPTASPPQKSSAVGPVRW